jgi:hypothetical protein
MPFGRSDRLITIGLRFESVTAPVEVIVVDGAEKSTNSL